MIPFTSPTSPPASVQRKEWLSSSLGERAVLSMSKDGPCTNRYQERARKTQTGIASLPLLRRTLGMQNMLLEPYFHHLSKKCASSKSSWQVRRAKTGELTQRHSRKVRGATPRWLPPCCYPSLSLFSSSFPFLSENRASPISTAPGSDGDHVALQVTKLVLWRAAAPNFSPTVGADK